jgi:hypothetical protein
VCSKVRYAVGVANGGRWGLGLVLCLLDVEIDDNGRLCNSAPVRDSSLEKTLLLRQCSKLERRSQPFASIRRLIYGILYIPAVSLETRYRSPTFTKRHATSNVNSLDYQEPSTCCNE